MKLKEFKKTVKGYSSDDVEIYIRSYDEWGNPLDLPAKFVKIIPDVQFDSFSCVLILEPDFDFNNSKFTE